MNAKFAYVGGEVVPFEEACVHIASAGFKFGAGVFEGIRGYWNAEEEQMFLFRLDEHMSRLEFSQRFMRFEHAFDGGTVAERTIELVRANELRENIHIQAAMAGVQA